MTPLSAPTALKVDYHQVAPAVLGIGESTPRLSWQIPRAPRGWSQAAYEVEVQRGGESQCHRVHSSEQLFVPWVGDPLASRESADIRLRVQGSDGHWSGWSDVVTVEAGLLEPSDWTANFMSPVDVGLLGEPAPILKGSWFAPDDVTAARLYVSALGIHEIWINGIRASADLLAPGWSSYQARLKYQTYDVTALLRPGANDVRVILGNGWFRGRLGWSGARALYGERLALLAQLEMSTATGGRVTLTADEQWLAGPSGVLSDDLYDGQVTDLRWTEPATWSNLEVLPPDRARALVAPIGPPVRVTNTIPAQRLWRSPKGALLVDFGQNLVGWVRLRVRGLQEGQRVDVRHAEVLEHDELGVRPLRSAKCTDSYLCAAADEQVLEPSLTFHGFRYAEVAGVAEGDILAIDAVVIGSDMARTGWFSSSNALLDRLHENVVWGMKGNFVDVPTDCPQRDERLGWTGDIAAFAPTALFLFDCAGLLDGWMDDLTAEQREDGSVPFVVPNVLPGDMTAAAWGDAATLVPYAIAQRTGDTRGVTRHLPTMSRWVDHQARVSTPDGLWSGGFQFGDWLDPTAPPDEPYRAQADPDVIATAYAIRSAQITAAVAERAGDDTRARRAEDRAEKALGAFRREYVTANGRVLSDCPTTYALALAWGLLPNEDQRTAAGDRLADLVRAGGFRISTGFVGTPLINDVLADSGDLDVAYRLLMQTGCPSWLYSVTMGATTVWERWDSMLPDGSINPGMMTSFNHYALGAVADFLHRVVGGLAPEEPGYRTLRIAPRPGGGLTHASARHHTPFGPAEVTWSLETGSLEVRATVPVGTEAVVDLPGRETTRVGHGEHRWSVPVGRPEATPPTTVRELLDDIELWPRFVEGAIAAGVGGMVHLVDEPSVADRLAAFFDAPVTAIPDALTLGGGDPGREALADLMDRLGLTSA